MSWYSDVTEDTNASMANFIRGAVRPPVTAYGRTNELLRDCGAAGCGGVLSPAQP
ncbi:hypothetical protein GCM10009734_39800 [Nonomuraea bangladeshensis]